MGTASMMANLNQPIEQLMASLWMRIPQEYRRATPWIILIGILGYGFEMTNLSLHHDDVVQFFHTDRIGHALGRFGYSWIHYYIQQGFYAPFFQVFLGILALTIYGLCVAATWKISRTIDVVLIASMLAVFPYMAQHYSYNTSLLPFSIAHALSAFAILLCVNFTISRFLLAVVLLGFSFSIYQSVIGNAIALACFAAVATLTSANNQTLSITAGLSRTLAIPLLGIIFGGLLYLGLVAMLGLPSDPYQHADKAFTLSDGLNLGTSIQLIVQGTRSFLFWPENYFPADLKAIQLGLIAAAALVWVFQPVSVGKKVAAAVCAAGGILAPRALQFLHPEGTFHNLTLTAYGIVVAGTVMVALRSRSIFWRNLICAAAAVLIFKYVMLSNWISTVNYLNFSAHQSVLTQILTRITDFPPATITRPEVAVIGKLKMPDAYPFLPQTGIATDYIDLAHLGKFSAVMGQPIKFVGEDQLPEQVREIAKNAPEWPAPGSTFSANGMAIVVLSHKK
jgi:hypothetical protein